MTTQEQSGQEEWEPIDSAPKDGSAILLWPCGVFGNVSADVGYWDNDEGYQDWRTLDGERLTDKPTHWMALPNGPAQQRPQPASEVEKYGPGDPAGDCAAFGNPTDGMVSPGDTGAPIQTAPSFGSEVIDRHYAAVASGAVKISKSAPPPSPRSHAMGHAEKIDVANLVPVLRGNIVSYVKCHDAADALELLASGFVLLKRDHDKRCGATRGCEVCAMLDTVDARLVL